MYLVSDLNIWKWKSSIYVSSNCYVVAYVAFPVCRKIIVTNIEQYMCSDSLAYKKETVSWTPGLYIKKAVSHILGSCSLVILSFPLVSQSICEDGHENEKGQFNFKFQKKF